MEVKFMPKIQQTQNGLFIYLPKQFTTLLKWKKGDVITIFPDTRQDATLLMKKTINAEDLPKKEKKPKTITNILRETTPHTQTMNNPFQKVAPETMKCFSFLKQ
jgi:hypothetical protein